MYSGPNAPLRLSLTALAFTLSLSATVLSAQNCTQNQPSTLTRSATANNVPGSGGGCGNNPGNPNPKNPPPPPAPNYVLNWSELQYYPNIVMQGSFQREGPAATAFDNQVWLAYTSSTSAFTYSDANGNRVTDYYVNVGTQGAFNPINVTNGVGASSENPALITVPLSFVTGNQGQGQAMILAVNGQPASPNENGGTIGLAWTKGDGNASYFATTVNAPNAYYAPSLAYDTDANILYLAYTNANDNTLVLCKTTSISTPLTCNSFPNSGPIGLNPGIGYFSATKSLYIAFQQFNGHALALFTSSDQGQTINESNALSNDSTSAAPSFVVHNGALYVGFRTKDSNEYFIYRWTTDGVNFAPDGTINNPWAIGSSPAMVDGNLLGTGGQNYIYLYYGANDGSNTLWSWYGQ